MTCRRNRFESPFNRLISVLLMMVLLFNSVGSIGLFLFERHKARTESEIKISRLVDLFLVKIDMDASSHPQPVLLNPHELRYKGRIYDIVYIRQTPEGDRYFAMPDERDTQTFARLNRTVQLQKGGNDHQNTTLLNWFKFPYPTDEFGVSAPLPANPRSRLFQSESARIFLKPYVEPPTPPPQAA